MAHWIHRLSSGSTDSPDLYWFTALSGCEGLPPLAGKGKDAGACASVGTGIGTGGGGSGGKLGLLLLVGAEGGEVQVVATLFLSKALAAVHVSQCLHFASLTPTLTLASCRALPDASKAGFRVV